MNVLAAFSLVICVAMGQNPPCGISISVHQPRTAKIVATCQVSPCPLTLNYIGGSGCPMGSHCCRLNPPPFQLGLPFACNSISPPSTSCHPTCNGVTVDQATCPTGNQCCWFGLGR